MSRFSEIVYNFFRGMSSFVAPEKLPKMILEVIENYDLQLKFGNLKKRRGYENIITTGLTTLKAMIEFINSNDDRQILLQDGTGLEETIWGDIDMDTVYGYDPITEIPHDERTASSTVDQMYPIVHNNEVRSPAGVGSDNYRPFIYRYLEAVTRYPNDEESGSYPGDPISIAAGKYLFDQFYKNPLVDKTNPYNAGLIHPSLFPYSISDSEVTDAGIDSDTRIVIYLAPVYDGYIKGIPEKLDHSLIKPSLQSISGNKWGLRFSLVTWEDNEDAFKRITAIDVFISEIPIGSSENDYDNYPAYFLERVKLDENGDPFLFFSSDDVTLDNTPASEKITIADFANWLTAGASAALQYFTVHDKTNSKYYVISSVTQNGDDLELTTTPVVANSGGANIEILPRWINYTDDHLYPIFYDNYHKKLRTEMYTYLNIPKGDEGLDDYKHKYGLIVNGRYVGFGFADGFGYYSPPDAYDVLCAQNILRPVKKVVGVAKNGYDAFAFYKTGGSRFSILGNANVQEDHTFFDDGLVNQKAVVQIDEDSFSYMGYAGPVLVEGRKKTYIGEDMKHWFVKIDDVLPLLTDAQKEACVAGYNHLKKHIYFSFPTYTTSPYTNGLILQFDLNAFQYKGNVIEPWTIFKTDTPIYNFTLNDYNHCLAGGLTKIVDFNGDSQDETVSTRLVFHLIKSPKKRIKALFHRLFLDLTTDDTITINAYYDGSSSPSALDSLNSDGETKIGQLKQSMKLEITTAASSNDAELSEMKLKLLPRRH